MILCCLTGNSSVSKRNIYNIYSTYVFKTENDYEKYAGTLIWRIFSFIKECENHVL